MQILIYTTPNCEQCNLLKAFLYQMKLVYIEKQIVSDIQIENGIELISADEFKQKVPGARSVPVVFVDGVKIGGFEKFKQFYYEYLQYDSL